MTWLKDLTQYMNTDYMSQSWSDAFANVFEQEKQHLELHVLLRQMKLRLRRHIQTLIGIL